MRQYIIWRRADWYAQRPRRLRIGIPICFTAVVELKCSSIINHCADILFIQRESRFQKGYPLFIIIFLNPYATLCILLNTICADISFQESGKGQHAQRPRRLRIGIPIYFLMIRQSSNGVALNTDTQHIILGRGDDHVYNIFSDYRWQGSVF